MKVLSLPPLIKHFEAFGVFADKRIEKIDDYNYRINSSDKTRVYRVYIKNIGVNEFEVFSNDNGTILKGYVGYPILACLIDKKILFLPENYVKLTNIAWKELNEKFKSYKKVLDFLESFLGKQTFSEIMNVAVKNSEILEKFKFYLTSQFL